MGLAILMVVSPSEVLRHLSLDHDLPPCFMTTYEKRKEQVSPRSEISVAEIQPHDSICRRTNVIKRGEFHRLELLSQKARKKWA